MAAAAAAAVTAAAVLLLPYSCRLARYNNLSLRAQYRVSKTQSTNILFLFFFFFTSGGIPSEKKYINTIIARTAVTAVSRLTDL